MENSALTKSHLEEILADHKIIWSLEFPIYGWTDFRNIYLNPYFVTTERDIYETVLHEVNHILDNKMGDIMTHEEIEKFAITDSHNRTYQGLIDYFLEEAGYEYPDR